MKLPAIAFCACIAASCGDGRYGPYWTDSAVIPLFAAKQESLSTSFNGRVYPQTRFLFGAADGFMLDKPNARLTVNANTVWQYAPIVVELYDGPQDKIGDPSTQVVRWEVPPPPPGGEITFVASRPLGGRRPIWAVVDFLDYSGTTILEVLGHD